MILFTAFEEAPGIFKMLALAFREWTMDFGFIHESEKMILEQFQVKEVPTLHAFYIDPEAVEGQQSRSAPYPGPFRYKYMKGWIEALGMSLKVEPPGIFLI